MSHQCDYSLLHGLDVSSKFQLPSKFQSFIAQNKNQDQMSVFLDYLDSFQQYEISMVQNIV